MGVTSPNYVILSALALVPAIFENQASALPTLSEVTEHLSRPPSVLHARYIKFYPDKPSTPWELFELHLQTNDYVLRRHQVPGASEIPRWIPTAEPEIRARIHEVRWSFRPADRAVIYYDPVSLGSSVDTKNPALEADQLAVLEINNVLNLGITYADRGGIKVSGREFEGANRTDGHRVSGTFLTSEATAVEGVDLLLRLVDQRHPKPREFHWKITYGGELGPENLSVYPAEMQYVARKPDGTRKPLERVKLLEVRTTAPLPPEAFRPDAILGTNISYLYAVHSEGKLFYTNALGEIHYQASEGKLDSFFERQKWIRRLFPILAVLIATVAFFVYRRRTG